jgi:hypothetical protein
MFSCLSALKTKQNNQHFSILGKSQIPGERQRQEVEQKGK